MSALWALARFWLAHHGHPGFRPVRAGLAGFYCDTHGEGTAA
jgi:hypothetical protein